MLANHSNYYLLLIQIAKCLLIINVKKNLRVLKKGFKYCVIKAKVVFIEVIIIIVIVVIAKK